MANVTYLLGAGASCEALPTYKNFAKRFRLFVNLFKDSNTLKYVKHQDKHTSVKIYTELQNIANQFNYHSTPDTLAKKYFHQYGIQSHELVRFKFFIILFFFYEQTTNSDSFSMIKAKSEIDNEIQSELFDKRYDAFIASILKPIQGQIDILPNFKVLTWNYDLQFEIAFMNYFKTNIFQVQNFIDSYPRIMPSIDIGLEAVQKSLNNFSVVHLNGLSFFDKPFDNVTASELFKVEATSDESTRLSKYIKLYNDFESLDFLDQVKVVSKVSFAWEKQSGDFEVNISDEILASALEVAAKTDILVVIGYSFPIFNDPIDRLLLNRMPLKEVYVQSPDSSVIISKLKNNYLMHKISDRYYYDLNYWNSFAIPENWKYDKEKIGFVPRAF